MNKRNNKVTRITTKYARNKIKNSYRAKIHIRRAKVIFGVFLVFFLILGFQIIGTKHQLAEVNGSTAKARTTLRQKKAKNRELKYEVKKLHDPDYLQELVREKYNFAKDGETIYQLVK